MHIDFDPAHINWSALTEQPNQWGGYNVFRGVPYQRGNGLGKSGLKNLLQKAADNVDKQTGKGFDFKRYKNIEKPPSIGKMNDEKHDLKTKRINKRAYSHIGPPNFIPNLVRKPTQKTHRKIHSHKRLRVDTLGTY
uniref:G-patch domain-containing protein n=1 Tax=Meloidogyne hapla TaxID=6305 RepID=A0A1I8B5U9_MELHA